MKDKDNKNEGIHIKEKDIISALLDELTKLNGNITEKNAMSEMMKHNGIFLYGINPNPNVDPEAYKKYVSFINAVTHVLDEFDINKRNNGYAYIIDAVMLIIDQSRLDLRLGDDVYPYIRRKYNLSSIAIVEHNIRNAIKSSYKRFMRGNSQSRMTKYPKKPTNKEFLFTVTHDVCSRMCQDLLTQAI